MLQPFSNVITKGLPHKPAFKKNVCCVWGSQFRPVLKRKFLFDNVFGRRFIFYCSSTMGLSAMFGVQRHLTLFNFYSFFFFFTFAFEARSCSLRRCRVRKLQLEIFAGRGPKGMIGWSVTFFGCPSKFSKVWRKTLLMNLISILPGAQRPRRKTSFVLVRLSLREVSRVASVSSWKTYGSFQRSPVLIEWPSCNLKALLDFIIWTENVRYFSLILLSKLSLEAQQKGSLHYTLQGDQEYWIQTQNYAARDQDCCGAL